MLIIRGGINSKKRELCPTALALSAFYYNKNKHADTYIMYLHAYSTSSTGNVYGEEMAEVKAIMDEVWKTQKAMLKKQPLIHNK
jgi:hypothetical protein